MGRRRFKSRFHRYLHRLGRSPLPLLEVGLNAGLAAFLIWTLSGFGGFIPYGKSLMGPSVLLMAVSSVHALAMVFRRDPPGLEWELILPVPFLVYLWLHYQFLSPSQWKAGLFLVVFVQAYAVLILAVNAIRGGRSSILFLSLFQFVAVVALLAGILQFYLFPDWVAIPGRVRSAEFSYGAAGFFMQPETLGSLLILFWPISVTIACLRRFTGPVRILNGFFAVILPIGILLTVNHWGFILFLFSIFVFPFLLAEESRMRLRILAASAGILLVGYFLLNRFAEGLQERFRYFGDWSGANFPDPSLAAASGMFRSAPFLGQGLGGFSMLWEQFRPGGAPVKFEHATSVFAGILAELGLAGLFLGVLPVGYILIRALRRWLALPYIYLDKDIAERLRRMPRRRRYKSLFGKTFGRSPSTKVVLGGMLAGSFGFLLYLLLDDALFFPAVLFLFVGVLACMASASRQYQRTAVPRLTGLAVGCVPLFLSAWAVVFGLPRLYAQHLAYTGREVLEAMQANPESIFDNPSELRMLEWRFHSACLLDGRNAGAWTGLGASILSQEQAGLYDAGELAHRAGEAFRKSVEVAPLSWEAHYGLARCLAISGQTGEELWYHLGRAEDLAPLRPEPKALLGTLQVVLGIDPQNGRDKLREAIGLDSGYAPAREILSWTELGEGSGTYDGPPVGPGWAAWRLAVDSGVREAVPGAGKALIATQKSPPPDDEGPE